MRLRELSPCSLSYSCVFRELISAKLLQLAPKQGPPESLLHIPSSSPSKGKGCLLIQVGTMACKASDEPKSSRQAMLSLSLTCNSLSPQQLAHKGQLSFLLAPLSLRFLIWASLVTVIYTHCPWYPREGSLKVSDW